MESDNIVQFHKFPAMGKEETESSIKIKTFRVRILGGNRSTEIRSLILIKILIERLQKN